MLKFENGILRNAVTLFIRRNRNCSTKVDTFEEEFLKNHISINAFQRTLLSMGSAAASILDPHRGDMIACLGETTGEDSIKHMYEKMLESEEALEILSKRPRINSNTVNLDKLKHLPDGTLGKLYSNFLLKNEVTPDSRLPVHFVDDVNHAYVMQRYREIHDLVHAVLLMPTNMLGEVTVKWVEAIQTKLPMCVGGAIFGPIRLKTKHRQLYLKHYLPWAIQTGTNGKLLMNIYFEKRWEQQMSDFYKEMNINPLVIPKYKNIYN